jgi:hypothetical protein
MPKISNKGFGFIPVLVLSLLVGVVAFGSYTLYNKENVLPANTQLAQKLPTTNPGKNLIKVTLGFNPTPGTYETGKITLKVTSDSAVMGELNADMKKYGLEVQDYCMTAVCPKPRIVRPVITFVGNSYLLVEVPVTPMVKSISFNAYPVNMDPKMPPFSFENKLNGWVPNLSENNRKISLVRLNYPLNVRITLKSANSSNGSEIYDVYINGIGDDAAELIRTIRTSGIKRVDSVGNRLVTTVVKPNIVYDGQGRFIITALKNTKTFYANPSRRLNIDFTPMPNGWVKNKNGDGVDRVATPEKPAIVDITLIRNIGNQQEFEVSIIGSGQPLEDLNSVIVGGIKRVDLIGNQLRTTTLNIIPFKTQIGNGNSKLSLRVRALPNTRTFYVNSSKRDIKAVPGKIPAGWKLNNNQYGIDRIIK